MNQVIPTLRDVHHVGFTVTDLEAAIRFFTEVLGFTLASTHGPLEDAALGAQFDVPNGASVRWAFLRRGESVIELGAWSPSEPGAPPRNHSAGGRHLALGVTDLPAAIAHLKTVPGVRLLEPRGEAFVYLETPFGLFVQLVRVPA